MNHHAYLLVGEISEAELFLRKWADEFGFSLVQNPDFFRVESETFGIDDARILSDWASRRSFGPRKVFFISSRTLTLEAQNALLKTFEEPTSDTHFFLVVRERESIIPTLLSRMVVERLKSATSQEVVAREFLKSPLKERLLLAKDFEGDLPAFLDSILLEEKDLETRRKIHKVQRFVSDRAVSARLILEHLALVLAS